MPELPETETIARDLDAMVRGARIIHVDTVRPDVVRVVDAASLGSRLRDAHVARVWRRAKLIVLDLVGANDEQTHLVVQPRFTGGLLVDTQAAIAPDPYDCVRITLADARLLRYRDVRRLGTVALYSAAQFRAYCCTLGPEPLDASLTAEEFSALLRGSVSAIKARLMDQRTLAGVGNIYANEALWLAGVDPSRRAAELSSGESTALLQALRAVLTASIAARGTSFRDYRDARGEQGQFVEQLAVYGRDGQPCRRCRSRLVETHAIDQRSTVFCFRCQR
jgi:formamidopyrimidine-DNA glycosylase